MVRADWERGDGLGVKGSPHFFVGDCDWFCPSLVVRHEDGHFDVEIAEDMRHAFYEMALA